jgi:DNA-binding CsgD family transcriptional regulator
MAGPDYDWTNEHSLVAHRRNVAAQIAGDSMPPAGYPRATPEERRSLLCWAKGKS